MDVIVEEETKDSEETTNGTEADATNAKKEEGTDDSKSQDVQLKEEDGVDVVDTKSDSDEEESLFPDTTIQLQHIRGEKWVSNQRLFVKRDPCVSPPIITYFSAFAFVEATVSVHLDKWFY